MPHHRLHRAQEGGRTLRTAQLAQSRDLDRVPGRGPGAVRLQVVHRVRAEVRVAVGPAQCPDLARRLRLHSARHGPVVGGAHAPDHRVDPVAGRQRVGQRPQHQDPGALPQDEPVGPAAERPARAAAGEGTDPAQPHQQVRGQDQLRATGDGDTAAARAQRVHGVGHGHESTGTRRVQRVALAVQIEDRTDGVRSHVEQQPGHGTAVQPGDRADRLPQLGMDRRYPELPTGQLPHPDVHGAELAVAALAQRRDHRGLLAVEALGLPPGVLDRLTGEVDQQPVLGVHRLGPPGRYAVVRRVEVPHVRQQRHRVRVGRRHIAEVVAAETGRAPPRVRDGGELRPGLREEPPVLVDIPGPRKPAGHSHNRDVITPRPRCTHYGSPRSL